jgi:hypothetical protein
LEQDGVNKDISDLKKQQEMDQVYVESKLLHQSLKVLNDTTYKLKNK